MGSVIDPRGTSGAGKTWLVREVMTAYRRDGAHVVPLRREGRPRPMGLRLAHPRGGRPLAVVGHYEATRGGTDTVPETDGGLDEALRLADALADALAGDGHDVLLEGYRPSGDVGRTAALARAQRARGGAFHVLCLDVPLDACVRNVVARRRAGRDALPAIERTARAGQAALAAACQALRHTGAEVEWLDAAAAPRRTLALLGFDPDRHDGPGGSPFDGPRLAEPASPRDGWPSPIRPFRGRIAPRWRRRRPRRHETDTSSTSRSSSLLTTAPRPRPKRVPGTCCPRRRGSPSSVRRARTKRRRTTPSRARRP